MSSFSGEHYKINLNVFPWPSIIKLLDALPDKTDAVDFLSASYLMVAWRIMTLIRERVKTVSILIPQSAYSAARLSHLGQTR